MSQPERSREEERIDQLLGNLLRAGVILSAAVVLVGAAIFLWRHGHEPTDYRVFRGEPPGYRQPALILRGAVNLGGRAIIQLGLLLLIATPVARVFFSALAFAWQRDFVYVALTLFVLAVLLYSIAAPD